MNQQGANERSGLHLVRPPASAARRARARAWLLETAPDPLPDEARLILALDGAPDVEPWQLEDVVDSLVNEGALDRVQIGRRGHLTRVGNAADDDVSELERFQLQVLLDIEMEKILLFRVAIVFELIVLALLLRSWLLAS